MDEYEQLTREELISVIRGLKAEGERCAASARGIASAFPVFSAREQREFETSSWPMRIFDRVTLQYLAVNDAGLKLYGYTQAEFLAMSLLDTRHPEERP